MIKYFKELLETLKSIDKRLKRIESCVVDNSNSHGKRTYLANGHWND